MDKLLEQLESQDPQQQRLNVLELLGYLLTMLHWQRGIIDMLVAIEAVKLDGEWLTNWRRVIANCETYEQFAWQIAPSRAMLLMLQHYRTTGELPENWELLLQKDEHGRLPYKAENVDDIEDLLRRCADVRQYAKMAGIDV